MSTEVTSEQAGWRAYTLEFGYHVRRSDLDLSIRRLCTKNGVKELSDLTHGDIRLDLSESAFIDLDATLWLLGIIRYLRDAGNSIQLHLPDVLEAAESSLWSYLLRWDFFDALARVAGPPSMFLSPAQMRTLSTRSRYSRPRQRRDASGNFTPMSTDRLLAISGLFIERMDPIQPQLDAFVWPLRDVILLNALAQYCGIDHQNAGALISYISEEAVRNAILHASSDYVLCSMQVIDDKLTNHLNLPNASLRIVISDNGRGIPDVLRQAIEEGIVDHADLPEDEASLINFFTSRNLSMDTAMLHAQDKAMIRAATQPGIRSTLTTKGMGLHYLLKYATQMSATVSIRSGHGEVTFRDGVPMTQSNDFDQALGTLIVVDVPIAR